MLADAFGDAALVGFGQRRKIAAEEALETIVELFRDDLAADHLAVERVTFPVRRQMHMQMRDTVTEDIDIDEFSTGRRLQAPAGAGDGGAEAQGFGPIEIGDGRDMPDGFEIGKAQNFGIERDGQPPLIVAPDLDPMQCIISAASGTDDAILRHLGARRCRRFVTTRSAAAQKPSQ